MSLGVGHPWDCVFSPSAHWRNYKRSYLNDHPHQRIRGGGARINDRSVNATDKRVFVSRSRWRNPADGNHILIAGKTGIADIDIVANDIWIDTRVPRLWQYCNRQCYFEVRATHCSVVAAVSVVLQRERAHSRIGGTVVIIYQGGCSQGTVFYACVLSKRAAVPTAVLESALFSDQRSGANPGVEIGGGSPKQRIPTNSRISSPAGEVTQRVTPFRRREIRLAPVRRRSERSHLVAKTQGTQALVVLL